jgi:hypothetical protein
MSLKYHNSVEEISGFVMAAVTTPLTVMTGLADTFLKALIIAVVSGFVGAFAAHYGRKVIEKFKL